MIRPCDQCGGTGMVPSTDPLHLLPQPCPRCEAMPWLGNLKGRFVWADPEKSWGTIVAKPDRDSVEWRCERGDESYLGPCLGHPDGRPRRKVSFDPRLGSSLEHHPYPDRHNLCGWVPIVDRLEVVTVETP